MTEKWNNEAFKKAATKHYKACTYLLGLNNVKQEYKNHIHSDIYYLCGYVIECALKFYIMSSNHYSDSYTLEELEKKGLKTHNISHLHSLALAGSSPINFKWTALTSSIKKWDEQVRYNCSSNGFSSELEKIKEDIDLVYNTVFTKF